MNFPSQKSIILSVLLAIVGFVLITVTSFTFDPAILLAVGLLVGGLVISSTSNSVVNDAETQTKTLYVGNLPYRANESVVRQLFEEHGKVMTVRLLKDKNTGKRRGFGFVEMAESDADSAIKSLNDSEFQQRTLKVREAKQKQENSDTPFKTDSSDQSA